MAGGSRKGRSLPWVDLAPVADPEHQDEHHSILDPVDHPILSDPKPERVGRAGEGLHARGFGFSARASTWGAIRSGA